MMTVVHPKDRTTAVLSGLYEGLEVQLLDETMTNNEIRHYLNHANPFEPLMILGHGSDKGLYSRKDDTAEGFDRILVGKHHLYYLRQQHRLMGIWCHANLFAKEHHLSGLFTGMFISEMSEAYEYGVETTEEELQTELCKFVNRLRGLMDEGVPYADIPERLLQLDDVHSPLTEFNYHSVYYVNGRVYDF